MNITIKRGDILDLEILRRFNKKFSKSYRFWTNPILQKNMEHQVSSFELIQKDGQPVGFIKLYGKNYGDWTGKRLFQQLVFIDTEYVEPNERGNGIITQARELVFKKWKINTVSVSFKHILDGLNYWQKNNFKYAVRRQDDGVDGKRTILNDSLFFITQKDNLIENQYVRKLTKENLLRFVKDFKHYSLDTLKKYEDEDKHEMIIANDSNNNKKRVDEYYRREERLIQSETDELLEQLLEVA